MVILKMQQQHTGIRVYQAGHKNQFKTPIAFSIGMVKYDIALFVWHSTWLF